MRQHEAWPFLWPAGKLQAPLNDRLYRLQHVSLQEMLTVDLMA